MSVDKRELLKFIGFYLIWTLMAVLNFTLLDYMKEQ